MEETAVFICNTANKLSKSEKKAYYEYKPLTSISTMNSEQNNENSEENLEKEKETPEQTDKDYINVVKKVKKENITPDNIAEIMLCQIPGISSVTALAIIDKFKSITNLLKQTEQNIDCLKDIIYTNNKGQIRKISKSCSTNIVKFLLKK